MPKRVHIDIIPKSPGGEHIDAQQISADEIEFDSEITIKSSLLRECKPGNVWFEEGDPDDDDNKPKFVARKSMDLRKLRSEKDRFQAICSSPMVDSRPRRLSYSKSFSEGVFEPSNSKTPLRLPRYDDLVSSTSRRLSRIIINRRSSLLGTTYNNLSVGSLQLNTPTSARRGKQCIEKENPATAEVKENIKPSTNSITTLTPITKGIFNDGLSSPIHDPCSVSEFRVLADMETARLVALCGDWNCVLSEECDSIPEKALDSIRATVGKCQLLLQKKLPFFQSLIDMAETSLEKSNTPSNTKTAPEATINDLLGYWTLVADEISLSDSAFERLRIWRDELHWSVDHCPVTPARSQIVKRRGRSSKQLKRLPTPKSNKTKESQSVIGGVLNISSQNLLPSQKLGSNIKATKGVQKKPVRSRFAEFLRTKKAVLTEATTADYGQ
ncbi:disks large associated 5 [Schistosoma japonicum]|uniref:Disks large associated 5 n=1 Tax=Schistosoma japonicum TaxID=6182 RepID=A0A4Z2DNH3_SCHJA|nr:disks large associated 5 [Schistosoma japonicum]TNN18073.1 disks large associated 5 [Schistosoma japonicum]TNN18074.1 disks large associated 5 [Schistosoma japonicum]